MYILFILNINNLLEILVKYPSGYRVVHGSSKSWCSSSKIGCNRNTLQKWKRWWVGKGTSSTNHQLCQQMVMVSLGCHDGIIRRHDVPAPRVRIRESIIPRYIRAWLKSQSVDRRDQRGLGRGGIMGKFGKFLISSYVATLLLARCTYLVSSI